MGSTGSPGASSAWVFPSKWWKTHWWGRSDWRDCLVCRELVKSPTLEILKI